MANPKDIISVDMSGVTSSVVVPEGDYMVKVKDITKEVGADSGKPYLKWVFEIVGGPFAGNPLWHNTSLQPKALFNLRKVLVSLGVAVPDGVMSLNFVDIKNRLCMVTVKHEEYEGKPKAKIEEFYPLPEDAGTVALGNSAPEDDVVDLEDDEDL